MILIEARKLTKEYVVGNFKNQVIKGIDLEVKEKEFISIVGPSGSGKTTLLYLLSGLEKYTTGEILLFNKERNVFIEAKEYWICISIL
jgi:putative ABC transport system ATP-binding protein